MKLGIHPLLFGVSVGVRLPNVEEKVQPEDGLPLTRCRVQLSTTRRKKRESARERPVAYIIVHILAANLVIILSNTNILIKSAKNIYLYHERVAFVKAAAGLGVKAVLLKEQFQVILLFWNKGQ